ncbi:MAG TPA: PIG-L family deacetylase [Terriglobia bacterium]|nr:PIG-L family deacetylase [Terriglobia bacterium]
MANRENTDKEWLSYVERVTRAVDSGRSIALGPSAAPPLPLAIADRKPEGAKIVYCSPHPDDESLGGAFALRLRMEAGARVTNVAITLGSDLTQRDRRHRELSSACKVLGFELIIPVEPATGAASGFDHITVESRRENSQAWEAQVRVLADIFAREQPEAIFMPHSDDFNDAHIGTHYLAFDALDQYLSTRPRASVLVIETEFWHEMADPNLMVGIAAGQAAIQMTAATEHGGEMSRMPYHLLHPCRMMNNVRRGSEVVGGQGAGVQPFTFAELHRVSFRHGHERVETPVEGRILPPSETATLDWLRQKFGFEASE